MKRDTQSLLNDEFKINIIINCVRLPIEQTYISTHHIIFYASEYKKGYLKLKKKYNLSWEHYDIRNNSSYIVSIDSSDFYKELLKPKIYLWIETTIDGKEFFIPKNEVRKICKEYNKWKTEIAS